MNRPRLALLNAAHEPARPGRNFRRELDAELVEFRVVEGEVPPSPASVDADGVVVTGSPASVYGAEDWITPTREWVADAIDAGLPHLGVCFGHQLLADVLGGTVEAMGSYELGYRPVRHHGGRLFEGIGEEFLAFTTHSDAVTELPPGAEPTAENDCCVQGFRKGAVFGVQFHPEYDRDTAERIVRRKPLPDERIRPVLDGITERNARLAREATGVFDNFLDYVSEDRPTAGDGRRPSARARTK